MQGLKAVGHKGFKVKRIKGLKDLKNLKDQVVKGLEIL
jgi:hypothetical protein